PPEKVISFGRATRVRLSAPPDPRISGRREVPCAPAPAVVGRRAVTPRRSRDLALDLLRGYFLVVIMIDHLRYAANPLYLVSGRQSLWVTAAEGFILISGFLVGMLRGDEARTAGLASATRHLVRRAGVLALWCAVLTIAFRT